jgi:hypothetical protein
VIAYLRNIFLLGDRTLQVDYNHVADGSLCDTHAASLHRFWAADHRYDDGDVVSPILGARMAMPSVQN